MGWNLKSLFGIPGKATSAAVQDLKSRAAALDAALAIAEFDVSGRILAANEKYLQSFGYVAAEVLGQHHSLFLPAGERGSDDYRQLWEKLARGGSAEGQYRRTAKNGREVLLQASYSPVLDAHGRCGRVIEYAIDVTEQTAAMKWAQGPLAKAHEVIAAATDGDFTGQIDTAQINGELLKVAQAVNRLLSTVDHSLAKMRTAIICATDGDLHAHVETQNSGGDFHSTAQAVNFLLESVLEIVTNVQGAASEVLCGAEEISDGNINLSQRTEQQSSSLEETASSMEQMTSTVKQNADNAGQASQLAIAARDQAEQGGVVVGQAVEAMARINVASNRIAAIIGVIDDIAFQTNLLALNAAVEAARAGEQGRGFAVVATEVRVLAGRSATAAKEIKELIQDSVQKVEDGSKLVAQSGQTLGQIVTSVKKVSDIVAEIAAASREQHSGIEQVNKAVAQMDEMTQQNAALVEQATAASQSMAVQARQLAKLMGRYNSVAVAAGPQAAEQPQIREAAADRPLAARSAPAQSSSARGGSLTGANERRSTVRPWSAKSNAAATSSTTAAQKGESAATRARKTPPTTKTRPGTNSLPKTKSAPSTNNAPGTSDQSGTLQVGNSSASDSDWLEF